MSIVGGAVLTPLIGWISQRAAALPTATSCRWWGMLSSPCSAGITHDARDFSRKQVHGGRKNQKRRKGFYGATRFRMKAKSRFSLLAVALLGSVALLRRTRTTSRRLNP